VGRWKNQMYVNGERYDTRMGEDVAAYGYVTAAEQVTVEFLFVDTNEDLRLGFSWVSLARMCGCISDRECPGRELCEGREVERLVGAVCASPVESAPTLTTERRSIAAYPWRVTAGTQVTRGVARGHRNPSRSLCQ